MKKILAILLAAMMLFSVVACTGNNADADNNNETVGDTTTDDTNNETNGDETTGDETTGDETVEDETSAIVPEVDANTLGGALWNAFYEAIQANPETSAEEMANALVTNPAIQFMGGAMALEVGQEYFNGFGEYKIEGYESGAIYMPMIGSIPFVGYIFKLADGVDAATFAGNLSDNCNPAWNVCVTADQTVVGAYENTVFFLMCPADLGGESEGEMDEDMGAELIFPTVETGSTADILFGVFGDTIDANPEISVAELANVLICHEIIPFMGGAMEVEPGLLSGFDNYEVTGFESGAVFMPMIGSIPFVGYVFELEEGADVVNFMSELEMNCNPAWNVCVEADQVAVGAYGNMVFFLMSPASFAE